MTQPKFDLFLFGATSEILLQLFRDYQQWFVENVDRLYLIQRLPEVAEPYRALNPTVVQLDCANIQQFRAGLKDIVAKYGSNTRPQQVFSAYGVFHWNYAEKNPVFTFHHEALQINLNARLQIIEAFRAQAANTRFHLFGSLFASFPYTGDYALSMWYINQLPRNSDYKHLDMIIYNLGGMKTRFWKHGEGPVNNPFVHPKIPTDKIFEAGFVRRQRGIVTTYPSFPSRIATWLGRRGVRVL